MSSVKTKLKLARQLVESKKFQDALEEVADALEDQPNNYLGLLLKGKCLHMLNKIDDSIETYRKAIQEKSQESAAWKGLIGIYQEKKDWSGYLDATQGLMLALYGSGDPQELQKSRSAFNQSVKFICSLNNSEALLHMQLPDAPIYHIIEGTTLGTEQALLKLIKIYETEERETINKHIAKNKFRIDAKAGSTEFLKYCVYSKSPLPHMYRDVLNLSHDDDMRRTIEMKLLKHRYDLLCVLPANSEKEQLHDEVLDMAQGMMLVGSPDPLAWKLAIDWMDVKELADLDYHTLVQYKELFPREGLARVIEGFLRSEISPFKQEIQRDEDANEENDDKDDKTSSKESRVKMSKDKKKKKNDQHLSTESEKPSIQQEEVEQEQDLVDEEVLGEDEWTPAQIVSIMAEGFEGDQTCVLSFRILAAYYLRVQEYETVVDIAQKGLTLISQQESAFFNNFDHGKDHLSLLLGTSYIYYQAPKNFDAALKAFDSILDHDTESVGAIIGKGLILREKGAYAKARDLLQMVVDENPNHFDGLLELSVCLWLIGGDENIAESLKGLHKCLEMVTGQDPFSLDRKAQIWWRIGLIKMDIVEKLPQNKEEQPENDRRAKEAYDAFVKSLHLNSNYAPAYSSLGLLYQNWIGDRVRASKCFYRAFEIDGGQIKAAKMLAADFAERSEWDLVEVIATRVVESDKIRTFFAKEQEDDECWPYRALGMVALNRNDYEKAVQYLQQSLRIFAQDANAWLGLGEAYTYSGRLTAASKAFERAMLFNPEDRIIGMHKAIVLREMQEYGQAIEVLGQVYQNEQTDSGEFSDLYLNVLIETCVLGSIHSLDRDMSGEAIVRANECLSYAVTAINKHEAKPTVWRNVSMAAEVLAAVKEGRVVDAAVLDKLLSQTGEEVISDEIDNEDMTSLDDRLWNLVIGGMKTALDQYSTNSDRAHGWYELGLGYLKMHDLREENIVLRSTPETMNSVTSVQSPLIQKSINCLKESIRLNPRNSDAWNVYGVLSQTINARVSQHSFIRSLSLNQRDPATYTNLAVLYMRLGDLELAAESLERALSIDAEFVGAWVCQAVIESIQGNKKGGETLFAHCYDISKGGDGIARLMYGLASYEQCVADKKQPQESAVLALRKFLSLNPKDELGLLIEGMLLERAGSFALGIEYTERLCELMETKYESSESANDLIKFCNAKAQLARLYLGQHEWAKATEAAETVLNILDEDEEGQEQEDKNNLPEKNSFEFKCKLSASLTAGLGCYFSDKFGEAIDFFKRALEWSHEDQDVVVLLAQVLWAHGGNDEREVALDQLYGSISAKGASVKITLLLGVLGLVHDPELLEAAAEELEGLNIDQLAEDREHDVQEVLSLINKSGTSWQRAVATWPNSYKAWKVVNPRIALRLAQISSTKISCQEVAAAYLNAAPTIETVQRAIFLAPYEEKSWKVLASALG